MDGKRFYAITTEDHEQRIGTWPFAGNVLTIHNNKPIPFNVNYTVIYREVEPSKNRTLGSKNPIRPNDDVNMIRSTPMIPFLQLCILRLCSNSAIGSSRS